MKNILIFAALVILSFQSASADVLALSPSQATILASDGSGAVRVALKFDLSQVPSGSGRQIIVANIDWPLDGLNENEPTTFNVKAITSDWSGSLLQSGATAIEVANEPSDNWLLESLDYERVGGFLRFRIPGLVQAWLNDSTSNHGVMVTFENQAPTNLQSQIGKVRLVIHYLFVPVEE